MHRAASRDSGLYSLAVLAAGLTALLALSSCQQQPENDEVSVQAATLPAQFTETQLASGMSSPTAMAIAPDGRIFVCQQGGSLRVVKNGALLATPFLTVSVNSSGERGLLGVAFDPAFATNHFVYIYYTVPSPLHNRVSRFTANGDVAVAGSETVILDIDNLSSATNHNGGAMNFGPDGKLYIAVGENATGSNAQSFSNLKGKMLRINKDGTFPADNPFMGQTSGKNRAIWAMGLRNPFTFAFQPGTGRMFINDVGQSSWEEINDGMSGANYGWPGAEGNSGTGGTRPFYTYDSGAGGTCSIIGAAFYNPTSATFPSSYIGKYFFGDYCAGWIRHIDTGSKSVTTFLTGLGSNNLVDIEVGNDGNLYYLGRSGGRLMRVSYTGSNAPAITQHPMSQTVPAGGTATFTVAASGSAPLSYQWQRNGSNISGATSPTYSRVGVTTADNGATFRCVVTNSAGSATSNSATLTVINNSPPVAGITAPATGTHYVGNQTINYSGTGTDSEDGTLPASAFTWQVDLHHDTHTHPFVPATTGSKTGSFVIPNRGETAANVWYRIHLTVRDSAGLTHSVFRDILPTTSAVTVATSPPGLQVSVDGEVVTTPFTFTGVVGIIRELQAISPQMSGGTNYAFTSWSDGGAATHEITTPAANTTYTASYSMSMTGLPAPWQSQNIGSVGLPGDATHSGGVFTVSASGADIWNTADAFRFVYQQWSGDVDLRARVTSLTNTNAWAKSGVMIRENLTAGSKNVFMLVSAASGLSFQQRPTAGSTTTSIKTPGTVPKWLRLTRVGSVMTGYWSDNGTSWNQLGSATVSMSSSLYVGLAVTSHNNAAVTQSNLESVSATGGMPPGNPPTVATPASASPSPAPGTTTALSVLGADDGGEAALTYTWSTTGTPPAAVSFSPNATNAAKNSTATFTKAGTYNFQVLIRDAGGLTATSTTSVVVSQTLTSVVVSPDTATVAPMGTQQFTATARDQFNTAMASQPTFTWSVSGGGSINSGGLFTAGSATGGPFTVTASGGGRSDTAQVMVSSAGSTVTLTPVADAHVRDGTSTGTNFGSATALELKNSTAAGNMRRAFLRFALTGVGSNVTNARLRLFGASVTTAKVVSIYAISDITWGETTINYNNAPTIGAKQGTGMNVPTTASYIEWDLTAYVQAQKAAGAAAISVEVKQDVPNNETPTSFNSKENASNRPQLVVTGS